MFYLSILGYENKDLFYQTIGFKDKLSLVEEILYSYFYTGYYLFELLCIACIIDAIFKLVRGLYVNVYETFKTIRYLPRVLFFAPVIVCTYISIYLNLNLFVLAIGVLSLLATGFIWLLHRKVGKKKEIGV